MTGHASEALHGLPTAAELVEAVREFLERDVVDTLEGSTRFHAKVSVNVLRIVERELRSGGEDVAQHLDRLSALGHDSDESLAASIRSGAEDHRLDQVRDAVLASVAAKLRVTNPDYLEESA